MNIPLIFWIVPAAAVIALAVAWAFYRSMKREDEGTPRMREIAEHVRKGAMAYLRQQYKVVLIVFIILALFFAYLAYGAGVQNPWVPFAFLTGGFFSGLAGYFGMKTATYASARTANAARQSLDRGLKVAFRSGAVMGLVVVGLGLLDISFWYIILERFVEVSGPQKLVVITTTMLTFGMGASTQALFARVGGGIYTKAADVGADLVGKVEAGIPEDDPRNPATIADNVGDNVGDVAGMGADLFESYTGSILAPTILAATFGALGGYFATGDLVWALVTPLLIAGCGIITSIIGLFAVRAKEGAALHKALNRGTYVAAGIEIVVIFCLFAVWNSQSVEAQPLWLFGSVLCGLVAGLAIGKITEYFCSDKYKPVHKIADAADTGAATVIIEGIGTGMLSTIAPIVLVALAIIGAYTFGNMAFPNAAADGGIAVGLFGVGLAATGMLSNTAITIGVDAYGPVADNAGGIAEMSGLPEEVRDRTDALDSLGNTTAATGKGFAIGSASLTALALLVSYVNIVQTRTPETLNFTLTSPSVLVGLFIGAMLTFVFSALTMSAVQTAAQSIVVEVRRQFREIVGIMDYKADPDYAACVSLCTKGALHEMVVPALLAIIVPLATGLVLGPTGVVGLLGGVSVTGFAMAVFMSNAGGAWDNAKKYIEGGHHGGKGSECHKAAVVGDTVGDPFKDTSGPSLNILIKLCSTVSIVFSGLILSFNLMNLL